jgi:hypothetical protein
MRLLITGAFVALFAGLVWMDGRAQTAGGIVSGAHRFEKVADGVYYATASGTMNVGANSPVLVNDDEVLIVDPSITPAAARALVADKIEAFQKYLRDVITQVTALRKQKLSPEEAAQKVDVTAYRNEFVSIRGVGIDPAAVRRIYQLADHPEPQQ